MISPLSWSITLLAAALYAGVLLWMTRAARRDLRRERNLHRLMCAGRLEAANQRRAS